MLPRSSPGVHRVQTSCHRTFGRHAGRCVSSHLKGIDKQGAQATAGDDILDFGAILRAATKVDDPLFYLEINLTRGGGPLVEVTKGYRHLHDVRWGTAA